MWFMSCALRRGQTASDVGGREPVHEQVGKQQALPEDLGSGHRRRGRSHTSVKYSYSPDGSLLVTEDQGKQGHDRLTLWDVATGRRVAQVRANHLTSVAVAPVKLTPLVI